MVDVSYEVSLVEDIAVAHVQAMALRLIDKQGVLRNKLAHDMGVSEARVSQLFASEPKNLTIKTAARLFYHLGEKLEFTCRGIDEMNVEAEKLHQQKAAALDAPSCAFEWLSGPCNDSFVVTQMCDADAA